MTTKPQAQDPIIFVSSSFSNGKGRGQPQPTAARAHAARKGHQKSRQKAIAAGKRHPSAVGGSRQNTLPVLNTPQCEDTLKFNHGLPILPRDQIVIWKTEQEWDEGEDGRAQTHVRLSVVRGRTQSPTAFNISYTAPARFVQMFFEIMKPSYTAAYNVFNVPNIIKRDWPIYMEHEIFLWTEAFAIQFTYEDLQGKPPSQEALMYKARALALLKRELGRPNARVDDYLVMAIMVLAQLELLAGDTGAHNAHKKMLRKTFAAAGGLHTYGSFVRNTTMRFDSFWSMTPDEPVSPAVPRLMPTRAPVVPPYPFSPDLSLLVTKLPEGFQALALQRALPMDVLEILGRMADPHQKPLPNLPGYAGDNRSPACGMYMDFWEACPSLESRDDSGEPRLERLISLACLIHATNRGGTNPLRMYNCISAGAIGELSKELPSCQKKRTRNEEHCLFWIWTITIDALHDRNGRLPANGQDLLERQKRRFPDVVGTRLEEQVLQRFWFRRYQPQQQHQTSQYHETPASAMARGDRSQCLSRPPPPQYKHQEQPTTSDPYQQHQQYLQQPPQQQQRQHPRSQPASFLGNSHAQIIDRRNSGSTIYSTTKVSSPLSEGSATASPYSQHNQGLIHSQSQSDTTSSTSIATPRSTEQEYTSGSLGSMLGGNIESVPEWDHVQWYTHQHQQPQPHQQFQSQYQYQYQHLHPPSRYANQPDVQEVLDIDGRVINYSHMPTVIEQVPELSYGGGLDLGSKSGGKRGQGGSGAT